MDKPSTSLSIAAVAVVGVSETIVTYPVEYIKTRRQLSFSKEYQLRCLVRDIPATAGIRGLYSEFTTLIVSNAGKSGVRFFSFETARSGLSQLFSSLSSSYMLSVFAALSADVAESVLVVTSGEAVKIRVINAAANDPTQQIRATTAQIVAQIVRQEGSLAFRRGLDPVVCKQGTNSAVRFDTFSAFKHPYGSDETLRATVSQYVLAFAAGASSGVITVYESIPIDKIKTRGQSQGKGGAGMLTCARSILLHEGIRVFWKATTPRLVRVVFGSSITFTVYDYVVRAAQSIQRGDKLDDLSGTRSCTRS